MSDVQGRYKAATLLLDIWRVVPGDLAIYPRCIPVAILLEVFRKNLNASKPSEHPPQVEECLKV